MKIKVCGMKETENIRQITNLPIDFIGFIFYPKSPRFVGNTPLNLSFIPSNISKVGVFVNEDIDNIRSIVHEWNLDFIQLHGNESVEVCQQLQKTAKVIKAFGVDDDFSFEQTTIYDNVVDMFVFDTKSSKYGGTGKQFNWSLIEKYHGNTPFLLSGGISITDISDLQTIRHPQMVGIDINSRFEIAPGLKNINQIQVFRSQVRGQFRVSQ